MELEYQYEYPGVDPNNSKLEPGAAPFVKRFPAYSREHLGQYGLYLANNYDRFEDFIINNPIARFVFPHEESEAAAIIPAGKVDAVSGFFERIAKDPTKEQQALLYLEFLKDKLNPKFLLLVDKMAELTTDLRIMGSPHNLKDEDLALQVITDGGKSLLVEAKANELYNKAVKEGRRFINGFTGKTKEYFTDLANRWHLETYPTPEYLRAVSEAKRKQFLNFTRENRRTLVESQISSLPQVDKRFAKSLAQLNLPGRFGSKHSTGGTLNYLNYIS